MSIMKLFRLIAVTALFVGASALIAQEAELKVEVKPKEAFIFVDGKAYNHHDRKLELAPGEHTIGVYNYGFTPQIKTVVITAGDNPELEITLQPVGGPVQGPWGRLEIAEAHNRDAVFVNGKTTDFFVGHVDETTSHVFLTQKMVLPPGIHQVTVIDPKTGGEVYAGNVEIIANRKAILNVEKGAVHYESWSDGAKINSLPRFNSTSTETVVAVAPVTGNLTVEPAEINCNQPARLAWKASDAVLTTIKANGVPVENVPLSGEQMVSPKETTTYEFEAIGPGGKFTAKQIVRVNNTIQTSLNVFPNELRFHQLESTVDQQGKATLKWTASNADFVRIDPIGPVSGASGETTIAGVPNKTDFGPIAEMKTYKITATNACGGSGTSTASLHITGSIDRQIAEEKPPELPQTASPMPLLGLLGF